MPIFGINQGAQPILGYNYGAKKYRRVLRAYALAVAAATAICVVGFVVTQVFPHGLIRLFAPDGSDALFKFAPWALRAMTALLLVDGFQIVSSNLFVVTGRPRTSILLSMLRQCIALIPCMLIFGRIWGLWGVAASGPVADGFSFIITAMFIAFELKKLKAAGETAL
jgi:Na+-driven multidrug efflux pump